MPLLVKYLTSMPFATVHLGGEGGYIRLHGSEASDMYQSDIHMQLR